MSRTASPSHSRRQSSHNYGNNNSNPANNHSFRSRPGGVPSSSGGAGGGGGGGRMNASRVPSPALMGPPPTSSSSSQPGFPSVRNVGLLLGWSVKLKLNEGPGGDRWVEGVIWCYDPVPGVLILESPAPTKGRHTYRMVKVNQIKDLQLGAIRDPLLLPTNPAAIIPKILEPVRPINVTAIAMRENQAVATEDARRARIGHGVSRWAQEIFDALGKTLPVRWHQTSIIILDDVLLPGPFYRSEDVKVSGNNQDRLNRVKQVLEGEWARLLRTEDGKQMELEARNSAPTTTTTSSTTATAATATATTTTTSTPLPAS